MIDIEKIDYSPLDRPEILMCLFHPRPEKERHGTPWARDVAIPVEKGAAIGGRFHMAGKTYANILFFHGNGEIVADYDELAPLYTQAGINFLAVDYRGYGRSTGRPTVTAMMRDCHVIYDFVRGWLNEEGYTGPFIAMGRSLGSAPVLELAARYGEAMDGLVVESGFARAAPLLRLLGVDPAGMGLSEEDGFGNLDKIRCFHQPTLIIHAECDHIIPHSEGKALFDACPAARKTLLTIPGANHNDIFLRGLKPYLAAVKDLCENLPSDPVDGPET